MEIFQKIIREIAFLAVLNFFPVQKIDFWPFLKLQKMEFGQNFCEIDLFDFTSFLAWTFLNFWPTVRLNGTFFQNLKRSCTTVI